MEKKFKKERKSNYEVELSWLFAFVFCSSRTVFFAVVSSTFFSIFKFERSDWWNLAQKTVVDVVVDEQKTNAKAKIIPPNIYIVLTYRCTYVLVYKMHPNSTEKMLSMN